MFTCKEYFLKKPHKEVFVLHSTDYNFRIKDSIIGLQFLFVAFGALVLVPILTGLDPNVALFTAGLGTLLFQLTTKERIPPIFLASSFSFIAPIIYGTQTWGLPGTLCGLASAGLFYFFLSVVVRIKGSDFLHKLFPAVVVGPVIMTIGLILSPVAVHMAMGKTGDGAIVLMPMTQAMTISMSALIVTMLVALLGKGVLKLLPIMCGIATGYIIALFMGMISFDSVANAAWFAMPNFVTPEFNLEAIIYILPIAIAPAVEHVGGILTISNVTKTDYLAKPGLKTTLLGDAIATTAASMLGGPPNTTYSEVTGAVTITKAFNPAIMTWAALFAILLAFVGKLGGLLATIPTPVMGGILLLLFGIIASIGLGTMVRGKVDMNNPRNMIIVSMILVLAIGGMVVDLGGVAFSGIGLGAIVGIILNIVLPKGGHIEEE